MNLTHIRFSGSPAASALSLDVTAAPPRQSNAREGTLGPLPALVLTSAGLDVSAYRPAPLQRRTAACLRALRMTSEDAAMSAVTAWPRLTQTALNALLIGVTQFFRDSVAFRVIESTIVPSLPDGPLRVLSVGCSSGAELYSVAMLLAEAGRLHDTELVGVDCRPDAVSAARAGVFPDAGMTGIGPSRRKAYFDAASGGWRVAYALRRHTTWARHDVLQATPVGPWDLVLCRNVCIYLQPRSADALLRALVQDLRPGGALVLGKAEQPPRGLGLHERARGVYQV